MGSPHGYGRRSPGARVSQVAGVPLASSPPLCEVWEGRKREAGGRAFQSQDGQQWRGFWGQVVSSGQALACPRSPGSSFHHVIYSQRPVRSSPGETSRPLADLQDHLGEALSDTALRQPPSLDTSFLGHFEHPPHLYSGCWLETPSPVAPHSRPSPVLAGWETESRGPRGKGEGVFPCYFYLMLPLKNSGEGRQRSYLLAFKPAPSVEDPSV